MNAAFYERPLGQTQGSFFFWCAEPGASAHTMAGWQSSFATLFLHIMFASVAKLVASSSAVRLVIGEQNGPTSGG